MNWSLVFPTRERLELLEGMLRSIMETAFDINRVEAVIYVDDNDPVTVPALNYLRLAYPFAHFNVGPRRANFSIFYYTQPALGSTGRNVMALNDDTRFITHHWDKIGAEAMDEARARWKDGIFMGKCDDGLKASYPCFPVLSREALQALGWVFHPEFTTWGADIHLHKVMSDPCVGRVIDLPFSVEHICHHTMKREQDHVNRRMAMLTRTNHGSAPGEAKRLAAIIDKINQSSVDKT